MGRIKKRYTDSEASQELGITRKELSQIITKHIPGYDKRTEHRITEDELSQIRTAIENSMCDVNQKTCSDMVWRACWPKQIVSFNDKDLSAFKPTTEMTGNQHLDGKPCLIFSRDQTIAQGFLETRKSGGLLELCLDNLDPDEYQIWEKTLDIHVLVEAVFREAKLIE